MAYGVPRLCVVGLMALTAVFHQKRVMRYPAGFPILIMSQKSSIKSQRWTVNRGESSEPRDLFVTTQSFLLQSKTGMQIFLRRNFNEEFSDFRLADCNSRYSYKVYRGETVIAEVNHNFTWSSWKDQEDFKVKVDPDIDYTFIVALLIIHTENVLSWCHVYV